MPECRTEAVRRIVRDHGPITKEGIFAHLGITERMKGSRSAFSHALRSEVHKGFILENREIYTINSEVTPKYQCFISCDYGADIIEYIKNNPGCTVLEICDSTGISPQTVRHHIRRLPVTSVLDVRTRRWYLRD